ncbi:hypothetical protein Syun_028658 [Stephania yunnanensis]|uniref:Uncharacterized protein n=1 Tax=Stephania yunnanensis TaxID=152371 RepID=A0AAP0HGN8_9MAGN
MFAINRGSLFPLNFGAIISILQNREERVRVSFWERKWRFFDLDDEGGRAVEGRLEERLIGSGVSRFRDRASRSD